MLIDIGFLILFFSSTVFSNEIKMRSDIQTKARHLFMGEKFEELERIAVQYRKSGERTSSGLWKLTIFYTGFGKILSPNIKFEDYWEGMKLKADKWVRKSPKSPTANIIKGMILSAYAWKIRGGG